MIAEARGLVSIPDELTSAEAAPLLCAGITTYNALRNAGLRGGDLVAVQGIVALGILLSSSRGTWIPYCRHRTWTREGKLAKDLGAHVYIDSAVEDARPCCSVRVGPEQFLQRNQW